MTFAFEGMAARIPLDRYSKLIMKAFMMLLALSY
ncbi:hypothetical protein Desmer_3917 [Desulfosporosinus meridiei DSM 13257]|uniref:Uncharacterized protein n=1 Tax=Desulfosporosinus meridiei (strain ATCC BAA-275 / DSM 13257 / KCTC 12902 / NCIMB 13706 / S10) TaxID=768704 RepID=J7J384_DESMD|nr:hypothetical protein Desmer_3917 [Desulfosporosinus meridiei DSM 13257]